MYIYIYIDWLIFLLGFMCVYVFLCVYVCVCICVCVCMCVEECRHVTINIIQGIFI